MAQVLLDDEVPELLGEIRLHPHQRRAVSRVSRALRHQGGCLLADDVGRGKTFVALAVARSWTQPLFVVPASLRRTWQKAMDRAGVHGAFITHEALSRGTRPSIEPDGIIVDESHRFRSMDTRRHAALTSIAAHVPVLLLSATPLQNGARDLAVQLALFLGSSAFHADDAWLARHVVRGMSRDDASLPATAPARWLHPPHDDSEALQAILALPPPARAMDAGDAGALRTIGLVRAWASSRAALVAAIQRRHRVAVALEQCASQGLAPRRRDLLAWHAVGPDVQLTLAPLLVARVTDVPGDDTLAAIALERSSLDHLSAALARHDDPDLARVAALRALRDAHAGARVLAFSEFASTVRAYYAALRTDAGVGMLTASEARIASGRLPRDALLDRFAPVAQGASAHAARERVTLLLATDLLSEGMNLQDASVVVHLDLPWNPARLAQRLGRVRRPGGSAIVHSYLMAPPAQTELLLKVEQRLRTKLARAERTVGRVPEVLPALSSVGADRSVASLPDVALGEDTPAEDAQRLQESDALSDMVSAQSRGSVEDRVASWRRATARRNPGTSRRPILAAVVSATVGWLAALDDGRLVARLGARPADTGVAVARAIALVTRPARPCCAMEGETALVEAREWLARERLASECGIIENALPLQSALERRMSAGVRDVSRHERPAALALAVRLRDALRHAPSLGAERELEQLLAAHAHGEIGTLQWLERSSDVANRRSVLASAREVDVVAIIVFGGETTDQCSDHRAMRPFGPTAQPVSSLENATLLYGTESTNTQVAPPSRERSVPVSPTAAINLPPPLGTNATADR